MKFSSTLQFNAVPEWRDHYIDYDHLKELIFHLERAAVPGLLDDDDSLHGADAVTTFSSAVDKECAKIDAFFGGIEAQLFAENDSLAQRLSEYLDSAEGDGARAAAGAAANLSDDAGSASGESSDDEGTGTGSSAPLGPSSLSGTGSAAARRRRSTIHEELVQKRSLPFENVSLRRESTRQYVQLSELLSYIDLNREGVRKALKKFDKVVGAQLGERLLPTKLRELSRLRVFSAATSGAIGQRLDRLVARFAELTHEPAARALEKLQGLLREHVVYERNTVWRELIGLERQQQEAPQAASRIGFMRRVTVAGKTFKIPRKSGPLLAALLLFGAILAAQPVRPAVQSRCLAVVVLASLLWSTEALPLFVTSLLVPLLVVVLRIPLDADTQQNLDAPAAAAFVFARMWSPVITVLLGGFALAAALSKYGLAKALAQSILRGVGSHNPHTVLLTLMFVAAFLCMWISNVAAPVLLFGVAQPLLRLLPAADPLTRALILGIALASNVGGMASPIASPQNILALQNMDPTPSWAAWFAISLPVCVLSILAIWLLLCATTPISREAREVLRHHIGGAHAAGAPATLEMRAVHYFVLSVTAATILLWCFSHVLEPYVGDMGVLALFPLVLLFGTNVLSAADFNNFLWTIVALAMGGIVLGKSVESCGLLATVAEAIQQRVQHLPLFGITLAFGLLILVVASFISHTVAALIILPLVRSIGEHLGSDQQQHPRLIVMISALLCSAAMALPTSGFPNVTAVCMVDELGTPYLSASDFMTRGVPASVLVYVVVVTVGYVLCRMLGF